MLQYCSGGLATASSRCSTPGNYFFRHSHASGPALNATGKRKTRLAGTGDGLAHVQGYWAELAARARDEKRFGFELLPAGLAARDGMFAEIYHPIDWRNLRRLAGRRARLALHSCRRQTWSATGSCA